MALETFESQSRFPKVTTQRNVAVKTPTKTQTEMPVLATMSPRPVTPGKSTTVQTEKKS